MSVGTPDAVVCRGITKDFPSGAAVQRVLHDIDLMLPSGQLTMLVGPSGCGKTTLISIIAGILAPTAGIVTVHGTDLTSLSGGALVRFRRSNLGFVFQQYNLLPALSAAENAAVPLIAAGWSGRQAVREAKDILAELDMAPHVEKLPRELSGGQQQRVAIARALIHEPRLVVCDEPTAALDAGTGRQVLELLRALSIRSDRAVIVVTHDNRIFDFADRIVHMEDGSIAGVEGGTVGRAECLSTH